MNTLIYTSILGFACMLLEVLNFRKLIIPFLVIGLAIVFGLNLADWNNSVQAYPNMILNTHFSVAFSGLSLFITAMIVVLAGAFYKDEPHHISDYAAMICFVLCGALMMFSFNNLVMLFIGIETLSISLYALAGSKRFDIRSNEAGFKYFLMGSFASGFLLFGIALIYGCTHSFQLDAITRLASESNIGQSPMFLTGLLLIVFAMMFKVSAAPFHFWAPDVYEGSPAIITAFMSTLVKIASFAAFFKLAQAVFIGQMGWVEPVLVIGAVLTLFTGNLIALSQDNFKRLLAYSGISHAGYMLMLVLSAKSNPDGALLYYGVGYSLSTLAAFAIALPVFKSMGSENIDAFNGLLKKDPFSAILMSIAMLGLAGIPPLAGFFGKYYIFTEALHNGYFYLTLIAIINSMIGIYYYFKVILAMYGKSGNEIAIQNTFNYRSVAIICCALSLLLGLMPNLLLNYF